MGKSDICWSGYSVDMKHTNGASRHPVKAETDMQWLRAEKSLSKTNCKALDFKRPQLCMINPPLALATWVIRHHVS
jgi:hypothetical protein